MSENFKMKGSTFYGHKINTSRSDATGKNGGGGPPFDIKGIVDKVKGVFSKKDSPTEFRSPTKSTKPGEGTHGDHHLGELRQLKPKEEFKDTKPQESTNKFRSPAKQNVAVSDATSVRNPIVPIIVENKKNKRVENKLKKTGELKKTRSVENKLKKTGELKKMRSMKIPLTTSTGEQLKEPAVNVKKAAQKKGVSNLDFDDTITKTKSTKIKPFNPKDVRTD